MNTSAVICQTIEDYMKQLTEGESGMRDLRQWLISHFGEDAVIQAISDDDDGD